ncbi:MAG: ComEC/Rec2 family competence protein [Phenylobacterium sp.]|uniref:ComEC/Rec2 family competence protein n=1 Tax=Phenylobacterium sp. TaxID=1871053 RepID=UPI00391B5229
MPVPDAPSPPRPAGWLARQAALQADRWTLWTPVALGAGAAIYFVLPREPLAALAWASLALALGLVLAVRRWSQARAVTALGVLAAFALAGFAAGKLRTERVRAPIVPAELGVTAVEGWVVDVASPGRSGARIVLAPVRVAGLAPTATPIRVRVTLRDGVAPPAPGRAVRLTALLNPPPPPAAPGAYDFARDAFFEGIGGVGLALSPPAPTHLPRPPGGLRLVMDVNAMRWALAQRIVATLGPEQGGLAAAMVTGHDAYVPRQQVEDMRAAGLAHIISISGLHMAIVGGFVFAAVRLGIAAWPWAGLRAPGKKLAAAAGLAAVAGYLLVSGAPPPAERAAITAGVAFGAMLADRRAISLHALAVAALVILVLQPEAVTEPGFQMSFSATAALVALAEAWLRPVREINTPWPIRLIQGAGGWVAASLAASFVAGLATGPFAIQHFNRVASFGLLANLAVAPISSFVMMPALALGAALTPLGLGEGPLTVAGWAIGAMTWIAAKAAAAPHAMLLVPSAPNWTLAAAFLGILWLCLWRGRLRWAGLPLALAVSLTPRGPAPDAWAAADGAAMAVRHGREAVLVRPDVKRFAAEVWAQRRGLDVAPEAEGAAARQGRLSCGRWECRPIKGAGLAPVATSWSLRDPTDEQMAQLCAGAEVVLVRARAPRGACPGAIVLDERSFRRGGAVELYRRPDGAWRALWAQDLRGQRPWTLAQAP